MALPIEGICEVETEPMIRAISLSRFEQLGFERIDAHAGLLRTDILNAEAEDAGELRKIVDVAAGFDHREDVALAHRFALLGIEAVFRAISYLVAQESGAVFGVV